MNGFSFKLFAILLYILFIEKENKKICTHTSAFQFPVTFLYEKREDQNATAETEFLVNHTNI